MISEDLCNLLGHQVNSYLLHVKGDTPLYNFYPTDVMGLIAHAQTPLVCMLHSPSLNFVQPL